MDHPFKLVHQDSIEIRPPVSMNVTHDKTLRSPWGSFHSVFDRCKRNSVSKPPRDFDFIQYWIFSFWVWRFWSFVKGVLVHSYRSTFLAHEMESIDSGVSSKWEVSSIVNLNPFFQSWNLHFSSVFNWYFIVHSSFDHEKMTIWFVISHRHTLKVSSSPDPRYPVTCISLIMNLNDNRYWLCVQLDERILEIRISLQVFIWEHR